MERVRYLGVNAAISFLSALLGSICLAEGIGRNFITLILVVTSTIVAYRSLVAAMVLYQEFEVKKERQGCNPNGTQGN